MMCFWGYVIKLLVREVKCEIIKKEGEYFDFNLIGFKGVIYFIFKFVCMICVVLMFEKGDFMLEIESVLVKFVVLV